MAEILEMAKKLGLNEYESKAYLSLLGLNFASASIVSKASLIPRARVYDVLTSLEKKGFIERKLSKPVSYIALSPFTVAKKIESKRKSLFEGELKEILKTGQILEENTGKNDSESMSLDEIRIVHGRQNIYSKISDELESASESVFFSTTNSGAQRKKNEFKRKFEVLEKKGVKVHFKQDDFRYCVLDKKTLFLFLNSDEEKKSEETALLIRNPFLARQFLSK